MSQNDEVEELEVEGKSWPVMILTFLVVMVVLGMFVFWLWNWIMPKFGLPMLTYGESCGLLVLTTLLFRSSVRGM